MKYRINPKNNDSISQLGLGCMRLPRMGALIDQKKTNELIAEAIESGVNFFDTAYIYPGSEDALGKALQAAGCREQVYIGTKLPHYMCKKHENFDRIFNTQLKRLQTGYIDYYFIHMLGSTQSWERLVSLGIEGWIDRKRAEGSIRNLGFSFHGGKDAFLDLIKTYPWDFCMVQYNYYDMSDQAGADGVKAAHSIGIPVFAMEPVRGGFLADGLNDSAKQVFQSLNTSRSPAEWALRWLFDQQEVTMVLSGMSNVAQLAENAAAACDATPGDLSEAEHAAYVDVVSKLRKSVFIPCTSCGYCMPCPQGVDIPAAFSSYNNSRTFGRVSGIAQYVQVTGQWAPVRTDASKCNECGSCEKHCPQGIKVPAQLKRVRRRMWSFFVIPLMSFVRKIWGVKTVS